MRIVLWTMACLLMVSPMLAQDEPATQQFEVATVKPVDPNAKVTMIGVMHSLDGINAQSVTLLMLIQNAYGQSVFRMADQVLGLPGWARTDAYNVQAKMSEAEAANMQKLSNEEKQKRYELLMQSLLAERFGLKVHHGTRRGADYELVIAKGGPKLKPAEVQDPGAKDKDGKPIMNSFIQFSAGKLTGRNTGMDLLTHLLSQSEDIGKPVVDKTGLTGLYNFTLNWIPTLNGMKSRPPTEDAISVFTAVEDDLGLKLVPSTGMEETLVIDAVQRPTAD